jgi:protease I
MMELQGKRIALLVEDGYQDLEVWYPKLRLTEAGAEVVTIGTITGPNYKGKWGYPITVDKMASEVNANDFDAIVIPGGWAPDKLRMHTYVIDLVKAIHQAGKPVAAICHAGSVLVSADIVKGKTLTSYVAIKDDLIHAGANWVDREVVVDGNLITSRKPDDLPVFCRELIQMLKGQ